MYVINQNPDDVIPNIREDFIKNKIILIHNKCHTDNELWIGVAEKVEYPEGVEYYWMGSHTNNPVFSWPSIHGKTLIELLIASWTLYLREDTNTIYVIESWEELNKIIEKFELNIRYPIYHYLIDTGIKIFGHQPTQEVSYEN
jgi:hypothetical protein